MANMDSVTITFRTTEEIKKKLDNIALDQNRTLSNMIETIILKWLEENDEKAQKSINKPVKFFTGLFTN